MAISSYYTSGMGAAVMPKKPTSTYLYSQQPTSPYPNYTYSQQPTSPAPAPAPTPTSTSTTNNTAALSAALAYSPPVSEGGGGGGLAAPASTSTPVAAYTPQAYNVNLPTMDWSFNPTEQMRGGWNTQATATAAQEIDPQLLAIKQALDQYMVQGQNTRNELNPRYTNQSLAVANIIQNSVKQDAINNAVRRGADSSGWLTSALMDAGKLETEQRSGIEANRNQDLNALAALEAQQTQATGQQNTALEKLRGQRITQALAELENQAWQRDLSQKQNTWNSALGGEQLRASAFGDNASNQLSVYQTQEQARQAEADRALQAALMEQNQANTEWEHNYTTSQDDYQRQLDAARSSMSGVSSGSKALATPDYLVPGSPDWLRYNQFNSDTKEQPKSPLDIAIEAAMMAELGLNPDGTPKSSTTTNTFNPNILRIHG